MYRTYYEEYESLAAREADRNMVFAALKSRGVHYGPRGIVATIFRLLGAHA